MQKYRKGAMGFRDVGCKQKPAASPQMARPAGIPPSMGCARELNVLKCRKMDTSHCGKTKFLLVATCYQSMVIQTESGTLDNTFVSRSSGTSAIKGPVGNRGVRKDQRVLPQTQLVELGDHFGHHLVLSLNTEEKDRRHPGRALGTPVPPWSGRRWTTRGHYACHRPAERW